LDRAHIFSRGPLLPQTIDFLHDRGGEALDVLRRTPELHARDAVAGLRGGIGGVDTTRVGASELLAQDIAKADLQDFRGSLQAMRLQFLEPGVREERDNSLAARLL